MAFNYNNLTLSELINKIDTSRFFNLPKMVAEALRKLTPEAPKYKVYTALLTQTGTDAPVATVLENTLGGDIVWSYEDVGDYNAILVGAFTENKTTSIISSIDATGDYEIYRIDNDRIRIQTLSTETNQDEYLNNSYIEIKIYN